MQVSDKKRLNSSTTSGRPRLAGAFILSSTWYGPVGSRWYLHSCSTEYMATVAQPQSKQVIAQYGVPRGTPAKTGLR